MLQSSTVIPTESMLLRATVRSRKARSGKHSIDGHDFDQIRDAFAKAKECKGKPTAIIMKTTKGKGVSYMENQAGWHGKAPSDEEYEQAMKELDEQLAKYEAEV